MEHPFCILLGSLHLLLEAAGFLGVGGREGGPEENSWEENRGKPMPRGQEQIPRRDLLQHLAGQRLVAVIGWQVFLENDHQDSCRT